jgi:hypothetical protein
MVYQVAGTRNGSLGLLFLDTSVATVDRVCDRPLDNRDKKTRAHKTVINKIVERLTAIYGWDKKSIPDLGEGFRFLNNRRL